MRRLIKALASAIAVVLVLLAGSALADRIEGLESDLIDRVGAGWGLGLVGIATVLLALVWLRYGGTNALRRWGVALKPLPPQRSDDPAATPGDDPPLKRPQRDPRTPTPR